jgi:hypothetical protein
VGTPGWFSREYCGFLAHHIGQIAGYFWLWFGLWFIYRAVVSKKPKPAVVVGFARLVRFVLVILTFGLLSGCSNPDPLTVASGPVFQLNPGHWQPAPQDLAGPPAVTNP